MKRTNRIADCVAVLALAAVLFAWAPLSHADTQAVSTGTDPAARQAVDPPQSLTGSYVVFDSSGGGNTCYDPGASQTLCFRAESSSPDWEFVLNVWFRFPSDWIVTNAYLQGTPVCSSGGGWGTFGWSFLTSPYEVNIAQTRTHALGGDFCTAFYCFDVTPAASGETAPVSWYWDGDGWGGAPHWPCSDDGYTPSGQVTCVEAAYPRALVPRCATGVDLSPDNQTQSGCNGDNATFNLTITNDTGDNATFSLTYSVPTLNGTLTGPSEIFVADNDTQSFQVTLAADLCLVDGDNLTGVVEASGNGHVDNATVTYAVQTLTQWQTVAQSRPDWGGSGYPGDGCTARNADGDFVTYIIGDTTSFTGFRAYNHESNTWFEPGAANTPSDRWAPDWSYDADTNLCYVTGGATAPGGGSLNETYVYDPVANAFTQLAGFSSVRDFHNSWVGTLQGGVKYLCVGGGVNTALELVQSTQCYDLSQGAPGSWQAENAQLGALPTGVFGSADGVLHAPGGDQFWYVGGTTIDSVIADLAQYWDSADTAWHSAGHTGAPRYRVEGDFLNGDFYFLGGSSGGFTYTNTAIRGRYNGATWDWTPLPAMNNARMDNIANAADGTMWSVAGYGADATSYVERLGGECYVCCTDDSDCEESGQYCTGTPVCVEGVCGFSGDPCEGDNSTPFCDEDNDRCVECLDSSVCPDDSLFCTGAPVCTDGVCGLAEDSCVGDTPVCDEALNRCVGCLSNGDCTSEEICLNNVCEIRCDLTIKYKDILSSKLTKPKKVTFTITGEEGFDPYGLISMSPLIWQKATFNTKKGILKVTAIVPAGLAPQTIPVRIGDCFGEVQIR